MKTNIPLPVEVMAGISLKNQKPNDTFIGYNKRVKLSKNNQKFILDANKSNKKLPRGNYWATIAYYPRWGAKNGNPKALLISEQLSDTVSLCLDASGVPSTDIIEKNKLQRWTMENVVTGTKWVEKDFVKRLGSYEKIKAEINLHDAYYFTKINMTFLVNTYKGTITVWRNGRATK